MAKTRGSRSSMRSGMTFLITFLVFLVLFGGVMIWGVSEFWRQTYGTGEDTTQPTDSAPTVGYTSADDRRLLLITEENGAAQGFVVLSSEPSSVRMRAVALPRETVVTTGTTQQRLFELYESDGVSAVATQVSALLGWNIDNTAVITYDGIQKLITYLGDGVIFTLTEAVTYENSDGATVTMKSGARTLSAVQTTDLLHYTDWHGGRRARADIQAQLAAAILNQYLVSSRFDEEDTDFRTLMGLWRSDILASQFAESREGLLLLARRNQMDICTVMSPAGEFIGVGDAMRFEMAEEPFA